MKENKLVHLSVSLSNVAHWGFWEAIRELLQNSLDMDKRNLYIEEGLINISTFDCPMEESTLLIGNSTKRDDESKIGKYGEGYKLACLVLLREGYDVAIRNGLDRWTFTESEHPQLGGKCLAVLIEYDVFQVENETSRNTVTFSIKGVTSDDIDQVNEKYLEADYVRDNFHVDVEHNQAMMFRTNGDPCVYVNGLFVCALPENYWYSYYLTPGMVPLDRDRSAVNTWELNWTVASLLEAAGAYDLIVEMSEGKAPDLHEYYAPSTTSFYEEGHSTYEETSVSKKLAAITEQRFYDKNGLNAFPISADMKEAKIKVISRVAVASNLVPIVIPANQYKMLSKKMKEIDMGIDRKEANPITLMHNYLKDNKKHMRSKSVKKFNQMIDTIILLS